MTIDKSKVEKEAKEILDKFASVLAKVEKECEEDSFIDRDRFERVETDLNNFDVNFKERMLANATNHDDEFIIGEKGAWK